MTTHEKKVQVEFETAHAVLDIAGVKKYDRMMNPLPLADRIISLQERHLSEVKSLWSDVEAMRVRQTLFLEQINKTNESIKD
jgi:hypothetical protein